MLDEKERAHLVHARLSSSGRVRSVMGLIAGTYIYELGRMERKIFFSLGAAKCTERLTKRPQP
jgi:hypothetical protein